MKGKSNFTNELEKDWLERIKIVKSGKKPEPLKQRNYFYLIRTITYQEHKEAAVTYAHFKYHVIYRLEEEYGYSREELGITAKPDGVLYTRSYGTELIQYKHKVYPLIAVIATEKSGIAESLSEYLAKYGIFVIDTTGNPARYPMQLVAKIQAPKFCIEDFDITGCFMSKRFSDEANAKRISLLSIMKVLKIGWEAVKEEDKAGHKNNHWDSIWEEDKKVLHKEGKYWRTEIDTVMKFAKPAEFAKAVLYLLDKEIPVKNMSLVMDLGEYIYIPLIPQKNKEEIIENIKTLEDKYTDERENILNEYDGLDKSFKELDLDVLEEEAKQKFQENVEAE